MGTEDRSLRVVLLFCGKRVEAWLLVLSGGAECGNEDALMYSKCDGKGRGSFGLSPGCE